MATPYRLKRSSVNNKRPTLTDLQKGELAFNFYNGHLFAEVDTGGVGIGTTIANLTPWREQFATNEIQYTGVVSATTYHGDQIIGTPNGGFKSGAFVIGSGNVTKDSINELNFILGKLVPPAPDTFNGLAVSLTGTAGAGRLCQGFTPTNNTGGSAPSAGTQYTRNTDSTITTNYINDVGPGDNGIVRGFVNAVGVGTTTLDTTVNNKTIDAIQIADNKDAAQSTRNTGITSQFYQVYDVRLINAASPDGFNKAFFTHGSATSGEVFWYEDPSTVSAPVLSFSTPTAPSSPPTPNYSSFIPHYSQAAGNAFSYVVTVTNASGDMYTQNRLLTSDGATSGFVDPGNKDYDDFVSGTLPPAKNYGVGTGATITMSQAPRDLHLTLTSNHFTRYDAVTPYGSHNNQRPSFSTNINIMGTTARGNTVIDEDDIRITGTLGETVSGVGNTASRVPSIAASDNPSQSGASYSWAGNATGTPAVFDAIVRGGVLRHDQTNYSTGYLPAGGPNLSSGRSGSQYFQFHFFRSAVSEFNITITGSYAGCKVCMPDNSAWVSGLSATNGWADMFQAYSGSGTPNNANPGCSDGGAMNGSSGTFKCVFGEQSSTNDTNKRILVRVKLTSGAASVTALSISAT